MVEEQLVHLRGPGAICRQESRLLLGKSSFAVAANDSVWGTRFVSLPSVVELDSSLLPAV